MKHILFFLLSFASAVACAGTQDELSRFEAELGAVRQEQQSMYQGYQMTLELRRMEVQEGAPPMGHHPYGTDINTPPPNYDDVVRAQMERERRIQRYTDDLKSLSVNYLELEKERKALLERIRELKRQQGE
ncbi:hypothetical protein [Candidatus Ferrigenium straubiae]|jgi:hypothetical protein|uniref:hypothetical protein n=1 Tax=Candidatus Ferrigenium straubiae TaxID=2919506 RepID=UPI003F4AA2D9